MRMTSHCTPINQRFQSCFRGLLAGINVWQEFSAGEWSQGKIASAWRPKTAKKACLAGKNGPALGAEKTSKKMRVYTVYSV